MATAQKTELLLGLMAADHAIELCKTAQAAISDVLTELRRLQAQATDAKERNT